MNREFDEKELGEEVGEEESIYELLLKEKQIIVPYNFKKRVCRGRDPSNITFLYIPNHNGCNILDLSLDFRSFGEEDNIETHLLDKMQLKVNILYRFKVRMRFINMIVAKILNEKFAHMELTYITDLITPYIRWDASSILTGIKYVNKRYNIH